MNIGELIIKLGFNLENTTLKEAINMIGDLNLASVGSLKLVADLADQFEKTSQRAIELAKDMTLFSSQTGLSAEKVQQLSQMTEQFGVNAQSAVSSIKNLQSALTVGTSQFESAMGAFGFLGIDTTQIKDAYDAFEKIHQAVKNSNFSDPFIQTQITLMGIAPEMIQILKLSDEQFETYQKNWKMLDLTRQEWMEINKEGVSFKQNVDHIKMDFLKPYLPLIHDINRGLAEIFKPRDGDNTFNTILSAMTAIGLVIAAIISPALSLFAVLSLIAGVLVVIAKNWEGFKEGVEQTVTALENVLNLQHGTVGASVVGGEGGHQGIGAAGLIGFAESMMSRWAQNNTTTMHNIFHIDGAKDPKATGDAVQEQLNRTALSQPRKRT